MKESATFFASATITVFLTGCIVIAHDLSPNVKEFLISLTGHHWTSVSLITILLFAFFLSILVSSKSAKRFLRTDDIRLWSTALMAVTLVMIIGILAELTARFLAE